MPSVEEWLELLEYIQSNPGASIHTHNHTYLLYDLYSRH